ncbi:MAG: cation-transporting P-type ATPase [Candidatus Moranbacteria bacterium]|nr:cation-transporting P-type ATPase [Candidatus Moranbacteria bacterium]
MAKQNKDIYNLSAAEALEKFSSTTQGLSEIEAEKRLQEFGYNALKKKTSWKWLKLIWNQFNDALVWILLVAAGLAAVFQEWRDVTIILIIVGINALIGFFQEFKAERILDRIRNLTTQKTVVFRDGEKKQIDTKFLVVGDVAYVASGDKVPADGYILESYDFKVDSFIFTGESKAEAKSAKVIAEAGVVLADIDNMVFMGETAATGEANFLVTGVGMATELGRIADLTQEIKEGLTPMQKQMRSLGRDVTVLSVMIGVLVMIAGQYFQMSFYHNFLFALALAVSVVPEGLPAAISVALSLGMKRLLKDNVLAKKLNAVETLGSVDVICTDKTGTITKNELMVTRVVVNDQTIEVAGDGYTPAGGFSIKGRSVKPQEIANLELLFKIGALCNDANLVKEGNRYGIIGDPTEGAIIVAGKKFNGKKDFFKVGEKKINENPFSSERMRMSVIYKNANTNSFVKGSPDVLLDLCTHKAIDGRIVEFTAEEKEKTRETYNAMSAEALRVLAFAYRNLDDVLPRAKLLDEAEKNLVWVGMMAMIDPPRRDVREAIAECRKLGIAVIMITGDYEITARAIARNIGLIDEAALRENGGQEPIINGKTLNGMKDKEVFRRIKNGVCVFARIAPEQKLRIATILKNNRQVIAMTGDGVNDAPALKKADIGVAMGIIGTDVSKEAADMILLDDNFASIVKGVREGRTIFANLKKFVHYVFTSNAGELLTVIFGVILQIPAPLSAVQILAVDLGTDIFPSFALGLEPHESEEKNSRQVGKRGGIITIKGFRRIIYLGVIMATGAVVAFLWSMLRGDWEFGQKIDLDGILYMKSTTAAYAVISMAQMANLLQSRSERLSPFRLGFFKNKYVLFAILISVIMLLVFMYVPILQKYLHMSPIDGWDWLVVLGSFVAVFLFEEARKSEKQ